MSRHMAGRANHIFRSAGTLLCLVAVRSALAQQLNDECYVNTQCLAREATRDTDQVKQDKLTGYITSLTNLQMFDLAREVMKKIDRHSQMGQFTWKRAGEDIAVFEVAAQALNTPAEIASLTPIEHLAQSGTGDDTLRMSTECWFVVGAIMQRSLWAPIDTVVSKVLQPLVGLNNATLNYLMTVRWPQEIERLPRNKQGNDWYQLAEIWLRLGERDRARLANEQAEQVGQIDFQGTQRIYNSTWRIWLALGNYERALSAADRASDRPAAANFKLKIAQSLVDANRLVDALKVIAAALPDVRFEPNAGSKMLLLREVVDLQIAADDAVGARATAEEMATLAHQRDLIPAGQLASAAAAFNDLGDHERADELLKEAIARLPAANKVLGFGVTIGPITGATLGLTDSLRSQIAVELYRSEDVAAFEDQSRQLGTEYRTRVWVDLCDASGLGHWKRPSESDCLDRAGPGFLVHWAADATGRGQADAAKKYLERAIAANGQLLNSARLAVAMGKSGLANAALVAAARMADRLPALADREVELAQVAAVRHQLLP
jgi:tetratricopeptide (TPR) repeat protein